MRRTIVALVCSAAAAHAGTAGAQPLASARAALAPSSATESSFPARASRDPMVAAPSAARPSLGTHLLVGTAIGAGVGLGVGILAYNNSRCGDCVVPDQMIPVGFAAAGAVTGAVVGTIVYLARREE